MTLSVKILRNERSKNVEKLADAELHFAGKPLDGLKLIGFAIWRRRDGNGLSITFPARQFTFHGERRDLALLRAIDNPNAQDRVRQLILRAYAEMQASEQVVT
jgi:hypothetical protein